MITLREMLYRVTFFFETLGMSPQQKLNRIVKEITDAKAEIYEEYKDLPLTRDAIECFKTIDRVIEESIKDVELERAPISGAD